jgi:hypothetical protein
MNVRLRIQRGGAALYDGIHDVADAESFGRECAHAWTHLQDQKLAKATSVGALYNALEEFLLDDLEGAQISLSRA